MSTFLLKEPRILWLTVATIVAAGVSSFLAVPRMEDPLLTNRGALVLTPLRGADAERVESLVTDVIVDQLREFDEIKELRSTSRPGISTVSIILRDDIYAVDEVWARIRDALSDARVDLPSAAFAPDLDIIDARAYSYVVGLVPSETTPAALSELRDLADECEDLFRNLANSESVDRFGDPEEEILVEVDQMELSQLRLSVESLAQQLAQSDAKVSAGQMHGPSNDLVIEVEGEFDSIHRIGDSVVNSLVSGQTAYLGDIANIRKSIREPRSSEALVEGESAILIAVTADARARLDRWTTTAEDALAVFQTKLPTNVVLHRIFRQSDYVDARIRHLLVDLTISALSVVTVVFVMMGFKSALIVGSALPLATCIVWASLNFLGIPFHQMSLSGLVIALGMLEGCAIIIVDDVQHRLTGGADKVSAVRDAISHMSMPLFGATATTIISFLPIATMPGPSGEFVGTIGVSVILALLAAFGLSLTIIPALSALLASERDRKQTFLARGIHSAGLSALFKVLLTKLFRFPLVTAIAGLAVSMPGFALIPLLQVQFFPGADRNQFHIEIELAPQASLNQTREVAIDIRERLIARNEIEEVCWVVGQSAPSVYYNMIGRVRASSRYAQAVVTLKPGTDPSELVNAVQEQLDQEVPQAQVRVMQLQQGPPYNAPIEIQLFGSDPQTLQTLGQNLRKLLSEHPAITHVQTDLGDQLPKLAVRIKEEEARMFGITLSGVSRQLDAALEGRIGGSLMDDNEELPVRVRLAGSARSDVASIGAIELMPELNNSGRSAGSGSPARLDSIAEISLTSQPAVISQLDGQRINEVRGYIRAGVLPSEVVGWLKAKLTNGEFALPAGYSLQFGGEASKRSEAVGQLTSRVTLLVAAAAFVLVLSLRSYRNSLVVVLVAVASCGVSFMTLFLSGFPLGFTAIVGLMGMVGVAINDSMVVLAELRTDPTAKTGDLNSVVQVIMRSSRHVLSTTLTVGCSFIPMIVSGGTFWPPMAMVIVGGVFGATAMALIWIPAVHRLFAERSAARQNPRSGPAL
ncbi:MAG TPA: acriflavine resistance protein B [Planctomycetaceae bacterium]|nr:acriflavine resistance protein B [Planctomycetaceae bacterium]